MSQKGLLALSLALLFLATQAYSQDSVAVDPAIRDMEISLEMPRPPAGSMLSPDPAIRDMQIALNMPRSSPASGSVVATPAGSTSTSTAPAWNVSGRWLLDLTEGASMDLTLSQSGGVIFGTGNVSSAGFAQRATFSGFVQGSSLRLDVVPADGSRLYALALDLSTLPPAGTYSIFTASSATPVSGTVRASKIA